MNLQMLGCDAVADCGMTNRGLLEEDPEMSPEEIDFHVREHSVVRVRCTPQLMSQVETEGVDADPTNSWFPPFAWKTLFCRQCDEHMGWQFIHPETDERPETFVALRLTALHEGSGELPKSGKKSRKKRNKK